MYAFHGSRAHQIRPGKTQIVEDAGMRQIDHHEANLVAKNDAK